MSEQTTEIVWQGLTHDCDQPSTDHLPRYGERHQTIAKWRCPECAQRWNYTAVFLRYDKFYWQREGIPSRRWRKAEARRLAQRNPPVLSPTTEADR